jgi:hypothetical protein
MKAVSGRRALGVGIEAVYPAPGLLFGNVVYIRPAIGIIRVKDEAYTIEEVILLEGLDRILEGRPGARRCAVGPLGRGP